MTVLLLTRDLSVVSQVDGASARVGAAALTISSEAEAVVQCAGGGVEIVVLDLNTPLLNVKSFVDQVKASTTAPPRIVAFGSHVHAEKLTVAREAGCDEVLSRGQFFSQLDGVLRGG